MSKSNITESPDGNQLHVTDSSVVRNQQELFISQYTADSCRVHLGHNEIHIPSDTHAAINCHACAVLDRSLIHVMCRTLSTPLRDGSLAQYHCTTPCVIDAGGSLDINCSFTVRAVRYTLRASTPGYHGLSRSIPAHKYLINLQRNNFQVYFLFLLIHNYFYFSHCYCL